jgi:hypothetical protein
VAINRIITNTHNSNKANTRTKEAKTKKMGQLSLFTFKCDFLKISVDIQATLAAETQLKGSGWRSN